MSEVSQAWGKRRRPKWNKKNVMDLSAKNNESREKWGKADNCCDCTDILNRKDLYSLAALAYFTWYAFICIIIYIFAITVFICLPLCARKYDVALEKTCSASFQRKAGSDLQRAEAYWVIYEVSIRQAHKVMILKSALSSTWRIRCCPCLLDLPPELHKRHSLMNY